MEEYNFGSNTASNSKFATLQTINTQSSTQKQQSFSYLNSSKNLLNLNVNSNTIGTVNQRLTTANSPLANIIPSGLRCNEANSNASECSTVNLAFENNTQNQLSNNKIINNQQIFNTTASVVFAMDRLSPYNNNYEDARNGNNLSNLTLDQIFKANNNDDGNHHHQQHQQHQQQHHHHLQSIQHPSNEALMLLNQNLECLKQTYASNSNQSNTNGNGGSTSSSPPSNLDVNSSPTSTSPSSTTSVGDTNNSTNSSSGVSSYGSLANSILNGTLTPPPDSAANSINNDSLGSFNPFAVKENMRQLLNCNGHQQQQQQQQQQHHQPQQRQSGSQQQLQQHSHQQQHQQNLKQSNNLDGVGNVLVGNGPSLISLVPATSSILSSLSEKTQSLVSSTSSSSLSNNNNNGLSTMLQQVPNSNNNCMNIINLMSPSKPSNISELSNSSMLSSSSGSSTLDLCSGGGNNSVNGGGTSKRSRNNKSANEMMNIGKDGKYFERRKRNNVAAKKSRDARKQREDEIAIRASFLEKENSILKAQLQTLKDEAQQLRILLAQKKSSSLVQQQQSGCSNCSNCSNIAANCAKQNNNVIGIINNGYGSNNLNSLGGYDHSDLDKQHQSVLNSATSSNLANASIYLQHQTAHRHPII